MVLRIWNGGPQAQICGIRIDQGQDSLDEAEASPKGRFTQVAVDSHLRIRRENPMTGYARYLVRHGMLPRIQGPSGKTRLEDHRGKRRGYVCFKLLALATAELDKVWLHQWTRLPLL